MCINNDFIICLNRTMERKKMQLLIIFILIILMYTIGYLTGYKECEIMAQQKINKMIKEHLEMKEYKISRYEEKES